MAKINLEAIENVTLYTGNNGTDFCTCKCPCCSQKGRKRKYQGSVEQMLQMFARLPNMKSLYIFGNPDVSVDAEFCNIIMQEAIRRNIKVSFSTSGIGGIRVLKKLLYGISVNNVDYISFSFDGITKEEMSFMKGINYPMEDALEGIKWCIRRGVIVKIQPTLWSCNYNNVKEIITFYREIGVKWFTFHIGSLESEINLNTHQHLTPKQIRKVHEQIEVAVQNFNDIKVRCPIIYQECGENETDKWYCMHPERVKELLIIFAEDEIKLTHVPMASLYNEDLSFNFNNVESKDIPAITSGKICPFAKQLSGRDDICCRYISKYWNY